MGKKIFYYVSVLFSNALVFLGLMSSSYFIDNILSQRLISFSCLAFVIYVAFKKIYTYREYYWFGLLCFIVLDAIAVIFSILILDGMDGPGT
jgi:hypothetical protein